MTKNEKLIETLSFIAKHDGCTQKDVLVGVYRAVKSRNYGRQSPASRAIAKLRYQGLLEDDCERCPHCGRASHGRRNVALHVTRAGRHVLFG